MRRRRRKFVPDDQLVPTSKLGVVLRTEKRHDGSTYSYYAERPKVCYGPEDWKHKKGCTRWHPKCRYRRFEAYGAPCLCGVYHFPHRPESGPCKYRKLTMGMPAILFDAPSFAEDRAAIVAEYQRLKAAKKAGITSSPWTAAHAPIDAPDDDAIYYGGSVEEDDDDPFRPLITAKGRSR